MQIFVVHDRTSLKTANVDNWIAWHVAPTRTEQAGAAAGTHRFDVFDSRAAFGGNLFRGRVTTVLPAGHTVTPVNVFGRNKVYRLEVRGAAAATSNTWLTVFDASASAAIASSAAPLPSIGGALEGTVISAPNGNNTAVLFSKSGAAVSGAFGIVVLASNTFCLVTDLAPGPGNSVTALVTGGQLTLQFAPGGTFTTTAQGSLALNISAAGAMSAP